jgi:hypothetical protein
VSTKWQEIKENILRNLKMIMLFLGVDKINIVSTPPNYWYMIFDSTLIYRDGLYYWAEAGDWEIGDNSIT